MTRPIRWLDRKARALLHDRLAKLEAGRLTLVDPDGTLSFGAVRPDFPFDVELRVANPSFYGETAFGGSVGAAESFMRGDWTASDIVGLFRIFSRNITLFEELESGAGAVKLPIRRLLHFLARNTREGSRRNIAAHYDLGNDFFRLFLDPTMTYSCAIFERAESTLEEASIAKLDRLCRKLDLRPEDHLLEIGTGWGSNAIHAAKHYGCRVTTTTISKEQHKLASERIAAAGLSDRITVLLEDYRDLKGTYDKAVSIEMIEAVGAEYLPAYFGAVSRLLKPDGLFALQAIMIDERLWDEHTRSVDFIKKYIFPGCCLLAVRPIMEAVTRASDLQLFHQEDITAHYVTTLHEWRRAFLASLEEVRRQGYSEEFIRMWDYYLAYCEGGFAERIITDAQFVFSKPLCRRPPILGALGSGA